MEQLTPVEAVQQLIESLGYDWSLTTELKIFSNGSYAIGIVDPSTKLINILSGWWRPRLELGEDSD